MNNPDRLGEPREVDRIVALGERDDGNSAALMMVFSDGSWSLWADGERIPIRIDGAVMRTVAEDILKAPGA